MADVVTSVTTTDTCVNKDHTIQDLVAAKIVKLVVDGVDVWSYTVPSGEKFNGYVSFRGQEATA